MSVREAQLESYLLDFAEEFALLSRRASNLAEEAQFLADRALQATLHIWTEIEGAANPLGVTEPDKVVPANSLEEGPPDTPEFLLRYSEVGRLKISPYPQDRTHRAFRAGFWARCGIDTHCQLDIDYPTSSPTTHWLVWSAQGLNVPVRFTEQALAERLVAAIPKSRIGSCCYLVGFTTVLELQAFCIGARIRVPARWQLSSRVN